MPQTVAPPPAIVAPVVRREFRGVWIATVANIDWPSKPGLPVSQQKAELIALLDRARALHLNAIVFQVRPMCDAFYDSPFEPWSEFLTGQDGKAPEPFYDPLQFAVTEAHRRGLELHAWFNPYRARSSSAKSLASGKHVSKANPDIVRTYGKQLWLDPAMPETREYSLKVILDVISRYDIDGVHIDDYFYPYAEKDSAGKTIPFPDSATYASYQKSGGTDTLEDFRRNAVDSFVKDLYERAHALKPWIKVGISPFGIPRPGVPPQIKGFDQRAELYADAVKWLNNGWCDYFAPQLYWPIEQTPQSFPVLLGAWIAENRANRALYPGLYTGKYKADEIAFEIKTTRGFAGVGGAIHFSMNALNSDRPGSVAQTLLGEVYAEAALIPEMPWLAPKDITPPPAPMVTLTPGTAAVPAVLRWQMPENVTVNYSAAFQYVLQAHVKSGATKGEWKTFLIPASEPQTISLPLRTDSLSLYAVDRFGRAGATASTLLAVPVTRQ